MRTTIKIITLAVITSLAACGGTQGGKRVAGGGDVPPPPPPSKGGGQEQPKVVVSADARSDFEKAAAFFLDNEKSGAWNQAACAQSAESFRAVASEHKELADAQYMVGLSYHRCGMLKEAESAYQATLRMNPNHAQSLSNLGEIYYRQGKTDGARQYWTRAVQAYQKLIAARNNLASMILQDMKTTTDASRWAALDKEAQNHLSSVLAVDNDNVKAYTLYALIYMEGRKRNKNRLDLAKLLMDEGEKRKADYAPLKNARGLLYLYRNNLGSALKSFQEAVTLDPKFVEARMNVGLTTLNFRNYPLAKEQFDKVLELDPKNYDAMIGTGIALRGQGDLDGAEQAYNKAKGLDGQRGEAFYNLGVLYKDFKATKEDDLKVAQQRYREAKKFFQDFLNKPGISNDDRAEAKNNVEDCDKLVKQVDDFFEMQRKQQQMQQQFQQNNPTPTPTPTPPAGTAPAAGTPAPAAGTTPAPSK